MFQNGSVIHFRIFSVWRLIAALVIMAYHFVHHGPAGRETIIAFLERMMPMLDMFFMISGALIFTHYSHQVSTLAGYRSYLARRFARIYPLHLITLSFFVAVAFAAHAGLIRIPDRTRYDLGELLPNLLLVHAWGGSNALSFNFVSWSLSAEWFCYLLLPVIVGAYRAGGLAGLALMLAACLTCLETVSNSELLALPHWMQATSWGAWRAFADFTAGAAISVAAAQSRLTVRSPAPAWLAMLTALVCMIVQMPAYLSYGLVIVALFLAAVSEQFAPERSAWLDIFAPAANVSFGIYMWHPVVQSLCFALIWPLVVAPLGVNFYAFLPLPMALSVAIAILSSRSWERWAGRKLQARLAPRPSPVMTAAE